MKETKGLLEQIKQHEKLTIRVSFNGDRHLPPGILNTLIKPHRTAYYFFVFVNRGLLMHDVDLHPISISDGEMLFILPNQISCPRPKNGDLECYKLSFDQDCLALLPRQFPFLIDPLNSQTISFDSDSKERVKFLFEILKRLLQSGETPALTEIILAHLNSLLTEFNSAYFRREEQSYHGNPRLLKYIEFKTALESQLEEQPSVNKLARDLCLTANSLYGIVKEFSGKSPKEFITNRLMLEAQRRLYYSKSSIKELSYDLGFNDPDYFSRLFKKTTGKSIREYSLQLQDLSGI